MLIGNSDHREALWCSAKDTLLRFFQTTVTDAVLLTKQNIGLANEGKRSNNNFQCEMIVSYAVDVPAL